MSNIHLKMGVDNGNSVDFNDFGSYIIKHYENYDGSRYFSLKACSLGCTDMLNIGAITFKDGEYEVYKLESKKDIKRIDKMIKDLDYDVCICENASKMIGKIDSHFLRWLDRKVRENVGRLRSDRV